jgi:Protein of unknown function (DUF1656).
MILKEINFFGVYLAPMALYIAIGAVAFIAIRRLIARLKLERFIWHGSLFDVALFASLVSLTTISAFLFIR